MPIFVDVMINANTVATMQIARVGEIKEGNVGDYVVVLDGTSGRTRELSENPIHDKEAMVVGFDRGRGAIELVEEALKALREGGIER